MVTRWLFADQLGPHFLDDDVEHAVVIVSDRAFRQRRMHRAKAHLLLSAIRHAERDFPVPLTVIEAPTFAHAWRDAPAPLTRDVDVVDPTSRSTRSLVRSLRPGGREVRIHPARGFISTHEEFQQWAQGRGRRRLLMEDFYRDVRRRTGVLMDGDAPIGDRWNLDADNRMSPPKGRATLGLTDPWWPVEDDVDARVRAQLDDRVAEDWHMIGRDGPRRFAVTRDEALHALDHFVRHRLATFGPYEDAAMSGDWTMSHSLLSVPLNLGLLDPHEVVAAVESAFHRGDVPLASAEGFIRQVMGWRDWVWHLYWHLGPDYAHANELGAHRPLPPWWQDLEADVVAPRCLAQALADVRDHGWTHHIPRLMVLGNWALQRGYEPQAMTRWFTDAFVDGTDWVMPANVIGMALHADGGVMATKPYASGGAYIKRMTDFCGGCRFRPEVRVGEQACPFTVGYWSLIDRHAERFRGNPRMAQAVQGLARLRDREQMLAQAADAGDAAP